jgi:hypothetical protein
MNNPWNTVLRIDGVNETMALTIKEYCLGKYKGNLDKKIICYIINLYKSGYGLKVLAREFDIGYSSIRTLFKHLNIEIRKGQNISTDITRKFRSDRVSGKNNPFYGTVQNSGGRGYQGYYKSRHNGMVWLRSSWEYIYAKWMDEKNITWRYELKSFKLSNGQSYRPDFFIYNNENKLKNIVEIKGMKDKIEGNRISKSYLFQKEYTNIELVIIKDIKKYSNNLKKDTVEWKNIRLLKKE